MKVLILSNSDEGIYRFRKELLIELLKDNEVFVSVLNGRYVKLIEELGCKYVPIEFNRKGTNPIKDLKLYSDYKRILNEIKPDVVLTYTIKPNVYGGLACQSKNIPYISTITGLGSAIENGGLLQKISLTLYKIGLRKVNKVFFQNDENMHFMLNKKVVNKERVKLVSGSGVNLEEYTYLDYPDDKTIDFVYVGRIMREKGFDQYVDAAKHITSEYSNVKFHVCGMYEDEYKDLVEALQKKNVLTYHGNVMDMKNEIYKNIQCTIHPSYYAEGLSNVLLETCACGRSIITTDKAGCKEVVQNGYNGFVARQKDSLDLINKIKKFINLTYEQRKQMGLNARSYVEKNFDRKVVIGSYLEEINKCHNQ